MICFDIGLPGIQEKKTYQTNWTVSYQKQNMFRTEGVLQEMNLTKDRYFIDTNIIVYMFDREHPKKRETAIKIVKEALKSGKGVISYQVIQEFCNVALKKFKVPMSPSDCRTFITGYLFPLCSVFPGIELFSSALEISESTQYSYYDSLILASSLLSGCCTVLSEDMQHNQIVHNMRIINPFQIQLTHMP